MNIKNSNDITPFDLAKKLGNEKIIKLCEQYQSVNYVIVHAKLTSLDSFPIKLSKIFNSYANPPFLSLNWRTKRNMQLAAIISATFNENADWSVDKCQSYLNEIFQNENINKMGTFKGLLLTANQLIEQEDFIIKLKL